MLQGISVRVKVEGEALASISDLQLLAGQNAAAIKNADGEWEVLQFRDAALVAPGTYALSGLLRGQGGTEFAMRSPVAAGARFVKLDAAVAQVDLAAGRDPAAVQLAGRAVDARYRRCLLRGCHPYVPRVRP